MTKEQFDLKYRGEKVVVHCDTEEKAKALLKLAKSFGYKWEGGNDLEEISRWENCKENTCYRFYDTDVIISPKKYYKENGYKIVEFELDEPSPMKESFKIGDEVTDMLLGIDVKIVDIKPFYLLEDYGYYVNETRIKKPLKKITKEQLAEMGYEVAE